MEKSKIDIRLKQFQVPVKKSEEDAWDALYAKLSETETPKKKVFRLNWFVGAVAASVVFLVIMYLGMFNTGKFSPEVATNFHDVDSVYLPDNSLVVLNLNSSVKYNYNKINKKRLVVLDGEAMFNVAKGKDFNVEFAGGNVCVKGTSFDIIAYSDKFLQVDCASGCVEFNINKQKLILTKGYGVKYFNGELVGPYEINPSLINDRINGIYYWEKVSINELSYFIGERFGYKVEVADNIKNRNFSGRIELANLKNCLNIVSYAMDFRYFIDETNKIITIE